MARRYRFRMRKGTSFMSVLMSTVRFVLYLFVGGLVLVNIAGALTINTNPFLSAFNLLGITANATGHGVVGTTGLISIIGILGAVFLVLKFVSIRQT